MCVSLCGVCHALANHAPHDRVHAHTSLCLCCILVVALFMLVGGPPVRLTRVLKPWSVYNHRSVSWWIRRSPRTISNKTTISHSRVHTYLSEVIFFCSKSHVVQLITPCVHLIHDYENDTICYIQNNCCLVQVVIGTVHSSLILVQCVHPASQKPPKCVLLLCSLG